MQIYFTDISKVVPELLSKEEATSLGLIDGMPFILDEDGNYDNNVNRFFRDAPALGLLSNHTWRAYAYDLLTWMRYLSAVRKKTIWEAAREDVIEYYKIRRLQGDSSARIEASSWNRLITALDKFYAWAKEEGIISTLPFTYKTIKGYVGEELALQTVNTAKEKAAKSRDTKYLSVEDFIFWRDVGMRGLLPDGREDMSCRIRNSHRNATMAELMVTTGLRIEEASSLLAQEIQDLVSLTKTKGQKSVVLKLAAPISKGNNSRKIHVPLRVLKMLDEYIKLERDASLLKRTEKTSLTLPQNAVALVAKKAKRSKLGRKETFDVSRLTPRERLVAYKVSESGEPIEPELLWLSEGGSPMTVSAWESIFLRASERCAKFERDIEATPHVLRHTFAVHMLPRLIKSFVGTLAPTSLEDEPGRHAYIRAIGDPLQMLQKMMGHSSITSTYIYLDCLTEAQGVVSDAIDNWDVDIAEEL